MVGFYSIGEHAASIKSPERSNLNEQEKQYYRELSATGVRPVVMKRGMKKFRPTQPDGPSLKTVQNFVNYHLRTDMDNHDRHNDIVDSARKHAYTGAEESCAASTFAWDLDEANRPVVGNGDDPSPFIVGITTKALLRRMDRPPDSFVFHLDSTFKTNTLSYPVLVMGILDASRTFHVVAMFVVSHRWETIQWKALSSLRLIFAAVTGKIMLVRYVLGDAEAAQINAVESVFADCKPAFLMCFFHVVKNVRERRQSSDELEAFVTRHIYDMHFTESESEFRAKRSEALASWRAKEDLRISADYFEATWLLSKVSAWRCFHTPPGFSTTNNPVETFNNRQKRDYTIRKRVKLGMLLRRIADCCEDDSMGLRQFRTQPEPTEALQRRANQLFDLGIIAHNLHTLDMYSTEIQNQVAVIHSLPGPEFAILGLKRSSEYLAVAARMGANYARMEHYGQPPPGWPVSILQKWCPCKYWMKFGTCVHVLVALRATRSSDTQGNLLTVDRTTGKRKRSRPRNVGPALSLE